MNEDKFGPCDCTPDEEDWEVVAGPMDVGTTDYVEYECQTCGETYTARTPLERV